jgi:hypothetical protein
MSIFTDSFYKAVELQTELGDEEAMAVATQLADYCKAKHDKKGLHKWRAVMAAMEELERAAARPN